MAPVVVAFDLLVTGGGDEEGATVDRSAPRSSFGRRDGASAVLRIIWRNAVLRWLKMNLRRRSNIEGLENRMGGLLSLTHRASLCTKPRSFLQSECISFTLKDGEKDIEVVRGWTGQGWMSPNPRFEVVAIQLRSSSRLERLLSTRMSTSQK